MRTQGPAYKVIRACGSEMNAVMNSQKLHENKAPGRAASAGTKTLDPAGAAGLVRARNSGAHKPHVVTTREATTTNPASNIDDDNWKADCICDSIFYSDQNLSQM